MKPIVPISLKRLAVRNMQAVQGGRLTKPEAARRLKGISREQAVTQLTHRYDRETARALQYLRIL